MQRFLRMIFAEGSSRPKTGTVYDLSAVNGHSLRFKCSATFCVGFHCRGNRLRNLHTRGSGSAGAPEGDVRLSASGTI